MAEILVKIVKMRKNLALLLAFSGILLIDIILLSAVCKGVFL
jgi:hypothetical protein